MNGEIAITNAHVGSLGDIITYQIDVTPDLKHLRKLNGYGADYAVYSRQNPV